MFAQSFLSVLTYTIEHKLFKFSKILLIFSIINAYSQP
ncbi:hypothetical protein SRA_04816 [Streptococcus ratti FA-1 = DSM 20564]|uniref:Uncharacterized protein n=1 Tax=Streptococcus ratti FA-1 = DSM 20564 TaxID=699248 RepID=A0ABP2QXS6_STRRT|nr:hypothetical protein SRA_04816 [Streptococcus ratti FA-1 = DSM 20564]